MSIPLKSPSSKSTSATLRTLYTRAARAFLHRDISLTHSLILSAFNLILPPDSAQDFLSEHRRKWDILRITLEITVYTAPPEDAASIPASLRSNAMLSSASLITSLHARSVQLFTPASKPDAAFLPAAVLVTLAVASVKVNSADVGRSIIEEWLARRVQREDEEDGYEKVLEVYCLNVLPALDEWDYAREFLGYEDELETSKKERLVSTLSSLYSQHQASIAAEYTASMASSSKSTLDTPYPTPLSSQPTPTSSRPSSPSSSTSSASTTSTHTAVPATPKPRMTAYTNGIAPLAPLAQAPSEASSAATSRTATPLPGTRRPVERFRTASHTTSSSSSHPPDVASTATFETPVSVSAVVRAYLRPYFQQGFSLSRFAIFLAFLLLPALSLLLRWRRRRIGGPGGSAGSAAVDDVRRRLGVRKNAGFLRMFWEEAVRAVGDTVRMGGRGLV